MIRNNAKKMYAIFPLTSNPQTYNKDRAINETQLIKDVATEI
jgi:hypothetical protein